MSKVELQAYQDVDQLLIQQLFERTFSDSEGESEGKLIGSLVQDVMTGTEPEDIFGFVASENTQLTGCIFFTRVILDTQVDAFLLSPVAVATSHQGRGVGQQLIGFGLDQLRALGVRLVITYGDPSYYARVGFKPISEDLVQAPFTLSQPQGWLAQSLAGGVINTTQGCARCVKAFDNPDYW